MAAESGASAMTLFNPIAKQTVSLQQYEELCSMLNKINLICAPSKISSSSSEPRKRRKRCRTSEQASLPQTVSATRINLGLREEAPPLDERVGLLGLSQNYSIQSYGVNKFDQGLGSKGSSNLVKNYDEMPRKRVSRIKRNFSNLNSSAAKATLAPLAGKNIGNKLEEDEKFDGFTKEIDDAITRIESLIPALQTLVSSVHLPNKRKVGDSGLPKLSSSVPDTNSSNAVGRSQNVGITRIKLGNVNYVGDVLKKDPKSRRAEIELPNEIMSRTIVDKPLNWVSTNNSLPSLQRKLELQTNLQGQRSLLREKTKPTMDRVESLKRTFSRNKSEASQIPEHLQGLGRMSYKLYKNNLNPNQMTYEEFPSRGSSNYARPNRASNIDKSHYTWSQSHTRGRSATGKGVPSKKIKFRDHTDRNTLIRKNTNGASRSKILLHHPESEDTSWGSPTSSSWSTQLSDYHPSSSETYQSSSISSSGSEVQHGKLVQSSSMRKLHKASDGTYNTSSYYSSSEDQYSDRGASSLSSLSGSHKWDPHMERGKRIGRFRRLKKKLGMIFHHHHHHHHHHHISEGDESDVGHPRSLWKRVGKMFHHTRQNDHEKPKIEKSRNRVIKRVPTKKQEGGGHFRALVGGLMRHVRHTKKSNQAKDEFRRIGNKGRGGKEATKKLPCWPKRQRGGRGGLKMANKGRVKFGRTRTRTPHLAAAKMILRQ